MQDTDNGPQKTDRDSQPSSGNTESSCEITGSLRDWFAGQALAAIISKHPAKAGDHAALIDGVRAKCEGAYAYADAMLAARKQVWG